MDESRRHLCTVGHLAVKSVVSEVLLLEGLALSLVWPWFDKVLPVRLNTTLKGTLSKVPMLLYCSTVMFFTGNKMWSW